MYKIFYIFHKREIQSALNAVKVLLNFGKMPQFSIRISQLDFHEKQASSVEFWYFLLLVE